MKKCAWLFGLIVSLFITWFSFAWACPGGDANDLGVCDTFYLTCYNPVQVGPPPWEIYFPLLVTHDLAGLYDSIPMMEVAFKITHTNPAAYCSIPGWRNTNSLSSDTTITTNSVFRHFDGMQNRMMYLYEEGSGGEWNNRIVNAYNDAGGNGHFWFSVLMAGDDDIPWWEGSKVLLATMTFVVSDTMTIFVENEYWPPGGWPKARFWRADAVGYYPQQNIPDTIKISSVQRGDANLDGVIDVSDIVYLINYLFKNGPAPNPFEAGDAYCDGIINVADILVLIHYLYKNASPPFCP